MKLADKWHPVQAFFDSVVDSKVIEYLEMYSKKQGHGINDAVCMFPENLDPDEEEFEGVWFSFLDDEVVITYAEFVEILKTFCNEYLERNPQDSKEVGSLLNKIEDAKTSE